MPGAALLLSALAVLLLLRQPGPAQHKTPPVGALIGQDFGGLLPAGRRQPRQSWRRMLQQQAGRGPPPDGAAGLVAALQGIQGSANTSAMSEGPPPGPEGAPSNAAPAPAGGGGNQAAAPSDGTGQVPCTDPGLLTSTMSTFCRLGSLDELAAMSQDAVQACCRLTSATLQRGCWDACKPPAQVSPEVMSVLGLWRTICLIGTPVVCSENPSSSASG